jgi:hypothetical protein
MEGSYGQNCRDRGLHGETFVTERSMERTVVIEGSMEETVVLQEDMVRSVVLALEDRREDYGWSR